MEVSRDVKGRVQLWRLKPGGAGRSSSARRTRLERAVESSKGGDELVAECCLID